MSKLGSYLESKGIRIRVSGKPFNYGKLKGGVKNYTVVSKQDVKFVAKKKLYFTPKGYVQTVIGGKRIDLQRYIANRKDRGLITGAQVDHKNRLEYDNTRGNLRQVSQRANLGNRGVSKKRFVGSGKVNGAKFDYIGLIGRKTLRREKLEADLKGFYSRRSARLGTKRSKASRAKQAATLRLKGTYFSPARRAKLSAAAKINAKNPNRIAALKGKAGKYIRSKEQRIAVGNRFRQANTGLKRSKATRARISASQKARLAKLFKK